MGRRYVTKSDRFVVFRHDVAHVYDNTIIDRLRKVWSETKALDKKERCKYIFKEMDSIFRGR